MTFGELICIVAVVFLILYFRPFVFRGRGIGRGIGRGGGRGIGLGRGRFFRRW